MSASSKVFDEVAAEKRFQNAKNTQESIQSVSSWAMLHKSHHEKIVAVWFSVLKKSKAPMRLTLLYLCNEIVQTCKRKHATAFKDSFKEVILEATTLVRDASLRGSVERIFTVWRERNVFEDEFLDQLLTTLYNKIQPNVASKLVADFKPSTAREMVVAVQKMEKDVEAKRRKLNVSSIDEKNQKYLKQLKDRSHGNQFSQHIEDIHCSLEDYVTSLEKEWNYRQQTIDQLEQSELFYDIQYGEAKIVANAYRNFGVRVSNLRKRLDDVKKTLPDPLSPIPSPTLDAPSPAESPVDDTTDNVEPVDMELSSSDSEEDKAYSPSDYSPSRHKNDTHPTSSDSRPPTTTAPTAASTVPGGSIAVTSTQETSPEVVTSTASSEVIKSTASPSSAADTPAELPQPVVTTTDQLVNGGNSASDTSVTSKLSGLLSMLPTKSTLQSILEPSVVIPTSSPSLPITTSDTASATVPAGSNGSTTPIKDEPGEKPLSPPQQPQVVDPPEESVPRPPQLVKVVDPIALLNEMLSQSRPATTSSSSVNFLQSLTMLTKTVTSTDRTDAEADDVYMGSYGKLDDEGPFTTSWSDRTPSVPDTLPPVKPLDRETSPPATVPIPISLASHSMGPPPLQSIYGMSGIPDITGSDRSLSSNVQATVTTSTASQDRDLFSQPLNSEFFAAADRFNPADNAQLSGNFATIPCTAHESSYLFPVQDVKTTQNFATVPSSNNESTHPVPEFDTKVLQDSEQHGGPLPENSFTVPFQFAPMDTAVSRDVPPVDEFTERLRRKTSMPLSDGVVSPPFPESRFPAPGPPRDSSMFDESLAPPTFNPPTVDFPTPKPVYHDQPNVDAEYDQFGGRFERQEIGEHNQGECPMLPLPPMDPVRFPPRHHGPPPMGYPRPDFYQEPPRRRAPVDDFRPRFMSRLPPPSAFSSLRPPPPPPERFLRPFFPRF